ncbi:MAG: SAM-dependent methyltransferase [Bacteroidetes bacterium]|nr:SAM-dependent methyltransferase [Bacteroidota bacterium]
MNNKSEIQKFVDYTKSSLDDQSFIRIKISKPFQSDSEIKGVVIKIVKIKQQANFQFIYSYEKKDITKNFLIDEGIAKIEELLEKGFKNFILFTSKHDIQLLFNKKMQPKVYVIKPSCTCIPSTDHNRNKIRILKVEDNLYLKELGIVTNNNEVAPSMQAKWTQINKFIEIVSYTIQNDKDSLQKMNIVDMGSGKGYLTFALYDYFVNQLKISSNITGIELRKELVDLCNSIAQKCSFENLKFTTNTIKDSEIKDIDLLIALHACNTATDDAIYKGITSNCSIIILSPCCHQQIRPELNLTKELKEIGKHGIMKERLAEMVTDTMRSIILEAYGYKTQIFEFISDEHTHKNLMIIGVKKDGKIDCKKHFEKLDNIKRLFGINNFYLENIMSAAK